MYRHFCVKLSINLCYKKQNPIQKCTFIVAIFCKTAPKYPQWLQKRENMERGFIFTCYDNLIHMLTLLQ